MKRVLAGDLVSGDEFKVTESSVKTYKVRLSAINSSDGDLMVLTVGENYHLHLPRQAEVVAVTMWREVEVPCLVARHEGGLVRLLCNRASDGKPIGVICEKCDAEATAQVTDMLKEPRRGDTVYMPNGSKRVIEGFSEVGGTKLSGGSWISASKLEPFGIRTWKYDPKE
jgi:hypothetical protein